MGKVSDMSSESIQSRLIALYDEYHRDIAKPPESKVKAHAISKICDLLENPITSISAEMLESVFNCYLFETNYTMSYGRFLDRLNQLKKTKEFANESKGTPVDLNSSERVLFSRSEENKRLVAESLKTGIVNSKAMYSLSEYSQLFPTRFKKHFNGEIFGKSKRVK